MEDGVGGDGAPEGVRQGADDAQGVHEGDVIELDGDVFAVVVGVKEDVDAGGFADGLVDDLGVLGHAQGEGFVGDRFQFGGRPGVFDGFLGRLAEAGFAAEGDAGFVGAELGDLLERGFVAGIDFGSAHELGEGGLGGGRADSFVGFEEFAAGCDVGGGGGLAQAVIGGAHAKVVGRLGVGLFVVFVGAVVVFTGLGGLALYEELVGRVAFVGVGGQGAGEQGAAEQKGDGALAELNRSGEAVHRTPMRCFQKVSLKRNV